MPWVTSLLCSVTCCVAQDVLSHICWSAERRLDSLHVDLRTPTVPISDLTRSSLHTLFTPHASHQSSTSNRFTLLLGQPLDCILSASLPFSPVVALYISLSWSFFLLPLYSGFSVTSAEETRIFKPVSMQTMWWVRMSTQNAQMNVSHQTLNWIYTASPSILFLLVMLFSHK